MKSKEILHKTKRLFIAWLMATAYLSLGACRDSIYMHEPLNISRADEGATLKFKTTTKGDVLLAVAFAKGKSLNEIYEQKKLWGTLDNEGTPLYLHVRISRESAPIINEYVRAIGTRWGMVICHSDKKINTDVRLIKIITLPPGNYSLEVHTLYNEALFQNTESYIQLISYDPKY